jgi:hypothetical protein
VFIAPHAPTLNPLIINNVALMVQAISNMLNALREAAQLNALPVPLPSLPKPNVSITSVAEETVGLGNRLGNETRNSFSTNVLKGSRLNALVRFQFWAEDVQSVDTAIDKLHGRLLAAKDSLRAAGFLRLALEETALADYLSALSAWRKTASYRVLYEFRYFDTDGAESLIAKIPIQIDSEYGESTILTGRMVRWDERSVPPLVVRGRSSASELSALAFIPGTAPTQAVTLKRTFDGAVGTPTTYPTLTEFLNSVAGPNPSNRHGQVTFPSLSSFLSAFSPGGDPSDFVELGDWNEDGVLDKYKPLKLSFEPAIQLPDVSDRLEIAYQGSAFDQVAVVYLQVMPRQSI